MGHLLGAEKINFLIRGAEVVSRVGGMLSIRGPQVSLGRLGSVLDVCNRLHRMPRCLGRIYQFSQQSSSLRHDQPVYEVPGL